MAVLQQDILIKGNSVDATAVPGSLKEREIAGNLLDRSLFGGTGGKVFKYYEHDTKYFDAEGNANNATKLGGLGPASYAKTSQLFVGSRAEYDAAWAAGNIAVGAIVIITDDDMAIGSSSLLGTGVLGKLILG